jgi:hypothetical protein
MNWIHLDIDVTLLKVLVDTDSLFVSQLKFTVYNGSSILA